MIPLRDDNPTKTFPYVTTAFIAVNTLVFIISKLGTGPGGFEFFIYRTAAIPLEVMTFTDIGAPGYVSPPLTILTSLFVHGSVFHLAGNMLYLWIFGDNIEDKLGALNFVIFYLLTGCAAALAHIMMNPASTVPVIGASGAIAGVLGAYFLLYPRANVLTLLYLFVIVRIVKIPAYIFLGLWFAFQLLSSTAGGGIAWYAHIGGFVAGAGCIYLAELFSRGLRTT